MSLLLKGPTGHLRSHGQCVNNFKSHSPLSSVIIIFAHFQGGGECFVQKVVTLKEGGGPQQTSTKLGFVRLG